MSEQPPNPDPGAEQPGSEEPTLRDSEAMLRGKSTRDPILGTTESPSGYNPGDSIGGYTIREVLGQGGMGTVYLADQTEPVERVVALKVVRRTKESQFFIRRFEAERQTLANMNHPCIAHFYDAGVTDRDQPYFVMEYVDGRKITDFCDEYQLTIPQRLELFVQVCRAVQHAHNKGAIHQDLSPNNILVKMDEDGTPHPRIIDFGISGASGSATSGVCGTPAYMSPEQTRDEASALDARTDIYTLGVVLYELLAGQLPLIADTTDLGGLQEHFQLIRTQEPPRPSARLTTSVEEKSSSVAAGRSVSVSKLIQLLKRELDWIPLKALQKDPDDRYATASAMADDIDRYLRREPLEAHPDSKGYRLRKSIERNRVSYIAAVIVGLVLIGGIISTSIFAVKAKNRAVEATQAKEIADQEREKADEARDEAREQENIAKQAQTAAEQQRIEALRSAYYGNLRAVSASLSEGDLAGARKWLKKAKAAMISSQASRSNAESVLDTVVAASEITERQKNEKLNEMRLASAEHSLVREDYAQTDAFKIEQKDMPFEWQYLHARTHANSEIAELLRRDDGINDFVWSVTFSPDGQRLASAGGDNTIRLWDVATGEELAVLRGDEDKFDPSGALFLRGSVTSVAFSPDGQRLASTGTDNTIRLWNAGNGEELAVLRVRHDIMEQPGRSSPLVTRSVAFSPDGTQLASGGGKIIRLWDADSGEKLALRGHEGDVYSVTFSPDGTRLASGGWDKTIRLWDVATGEELAVLRGHSVTSVTFSPDGQRLASAGPDKTIRLWDAGSGKELAVLRGHKGHVFSVAFSPDGKRLASGSGDDTIRLWDAGSGEELAVLRGYEPNMVCSVAFSPDGERLASGGVDNTIQLWGVTKDVTGGKELSVLRGHEGAVSAFTFSPDGTRMASGGRDKTIRLWDVDSCEELAVLRGHEDRVGPVKFSPDGRQLASASRDDTIRLWDAGSGEELAVLRGHEKVSSSPSIKSVAFSPDGQRLASAGLDGTIRLWDTGSGEELAVLCGHTNLGEWGRNKKKYAVESFTFSPDGNRLASGGRDKTIRLWDAGSGEELSVLRGHGGRVFSVKFSPDGQRLASAGGSDDTARLWDAGSGEELAVLRGHDGGVTSVTFSPDGELLASVGGGNTIRLWDAGSGEELAVLRGYEVRVTGSVSFSPDGTRLASVGNDKTIRLWDVATGEELAVLRGHEDYVSSVAFSPDGKRLASGSGDGTIRLWETRSRGQIAQDRRLSQKEMLRLTPLVDTWIEKSGGDDELVVALLEQEVKNRTPEEATTLRNLVLKKLVQRRQAKKAETTEPAVP